MSLTEMQELVESIAEGGDPYEWGTVLMNAFPEAVSKLAGAVERLKALMECVNYDGWKPYDNGTGPRMIRARQFLKENKL